MDKDTRKGERETLTMSTLIYQKEQEQQSLLCLPQEVGRCASALVPPEDTGGVGTSG